MSTPRVDFIGIGEGKSGSTWIFQCLKEHPELAVAPSKEVHFFDRHFDRGVTWYTGELPESSAGVYTGEYTPTYLACPDCPERIRSLFPHVKLIACLRDPLGQLISGYYFNLSRGRIRDVSLDEYLLSKDLSYLHYHRNLARYLTYFSREQILVLLFDDLQNNPGTFMQEVYRFLGVADNFVPLSLTTVSNKTIKKTVRSRTFNYVLYRLRDVVTQSTMLRTSARALCLDRLARKLFRFNLLPKRKQEAMQKERPSKVACERVRSELTEDIEKLEVLLERDLSHWCSVES